MCANCSTHPLAWLQPIGLAHELEAAQNMLLALHDLGYAAVWRTGKMAFNSEITKQMELPESNRVIGFLYVGTPNGRVKEIPQLDVSEFVSVWD